jgi:hypothetical protein
MRYCSPIGSCKQFFLKKDEKEYECWHLAFEINLLRIEGYQQFTDGDEDYLQLHQWKKYFELLFWYKNCRLLI